MRQTLSLRLLATLLGILAIAVLVSACAKEKAPVCPQVPEDKYSPSVCVDDSNPDLNAYPNTVHAANHQKPAGPSGQPVRIHWVAPKNHNLKITVAKSSDGRDCVTAQPTCNGAQCVATINPLATDSQHTATRCKYSIAVPNDPNFPKVNDPIIIVDNCCPD